MATVTHELSACTDCMIANANGEAPVDRPASEPPVWALWADDEGGTFAPAWDAEGDSPGDFSDRACGACGSTLAGDRFPYVRLAGDAVVNRSLTALLAAYVVMTVSVIAVVVHAKLTIG